MAVLDDAAEGDASRLMDNYQVSTTYNRNVGNIYTGSLYLSLLSLLEQKEDLEAGSRIGLFSYGSGAVGEFFTGILEAGFEITIRDEHEKQFAARKEISVDEYEKIFEEQLPTDGSKVEFDIDEDPAVICLAGVEGHSRRIP